MGERKVEPVEPIRRGLGADLGPALRLQRLDAETLSDGSVRFSAAVVVGSDPWLITMIYPPEDVHGLELDAEQPSREWLVMMLKTHLIEWAATGVVAPPVTSVQRLRS